ncbi:MAG: NAD-dependent epimerase/dehydratase family protein [Planctomycetota bacterium]
MSDRREFLRRSASLSLAFGLGGSAGWPRPQDEKPAPPAAPRKKLKLLILGGTGFLGPAVVEEALARGHEMTLFNRGRTNTDLFPDLEKLKGDRNGKLEALADRVFDGVIDTSGYVPRHVALSAEALKTSGFYAFVSSISVYPDLDSKDTDESTPVGTLEDPTTEKVTNESYGPLKALCEQAAEKAMPGRVANIRPGLIVGYRDTTERFSHWPLRVAKGGEVLAPGEPQWGQQYIDVKDLARFIVDAIERKLAGTFNALGPVAPTPMKTLLETSKKVSGSDARFTWVDLPFLEKNELRPWVELPSWSPPPKGKDRPVICSNEKAVKAGLTFRPLEDTIKDVIEWERVRPAGRRRTAAIGPDRERELLEAWHASRKAKSEAK